LKKGDLSNDFDLSFNHAFVFKKKLFSFDFGFFLIPNNTTNQIKLFGASLGA